VDIFRYDDAAEQTSIVAGIVRENLRRGFEYDDIVVVSLRGVSNAFFADLEQLEEHKARRFTGEYDDLGNQVLSDGRLTLETIYRFKGQQAPAVVLVDVDPDPHKPELATRLLYAGMTRATIRLDIVARRDNQITGEFVP
tara:strand:- start:799 stop:1218 length:420 start_codon:yes stop_codon:yes gene_type:complete